MTMADPDRTAASEWCARSAAEIAEAVGRRDVSAVDVVTDHLRRTEQLEPRLRMFAHVAADDARQRAERIDRSRTDGALLGVPVGVKDVIDTARMPTAHGTPIFEGARPELDATIVARIEQAGGIVIGKTVTNELGAAHPGPTRNPHDPERTPGGSSSGSAASVASGAAAVSIGTQTGGSVVRPASFCGVFGLKPTLGSIDRNGVGGHCPTIDTPGIFARSVEDLRLLLSVVSDTDTVQLEDGAGAIGFSLPESVEAVDPVLVDGFGAVVDRIGTNGFAVEELRPKLPATLLATPQTIIRYEMAEHLGGLLRTSRPLLSDRIASAIAEGQRIDRGAYLEAVAILLQGRDSIDGILGGARALVSLTVTHEAPLGGADSGDPRPHRIWSALGVPVLTMPLLRGASGLPVGVQIVGRPSDEAWMLRVAEGLRPDPVGIVP